MCAQKLTDASLIYRTVPKTKTSKMKKTKKQTDMLRRNGAGQVSGPTLNLGGGADVLQSAGTGEVAVASSAVYTGKVISASESVERWLEVGLS